jgi:hypothetical protein
MAQGGGWIRFDAIAFNISGAAIQLIDLLCTERSVRKGLSKGLVIRAA